MSINSSENSNFLICSIKPEQTKEYFRVVVLFSIYISTSFITPCHNFEELHNNKYKKKDYVNEAKWLWSRLFDYTGKRLFPLQSFISDSVLSPSLSICEKQSLI